MNMSFYTAAVGAYQQQLRMNVQANNIANVNTYGYKAEKATFAQLMYGTIRGIDGEELPRGAGTQMVKATTDFSQSALMETGRSLDFAILGNGFFALYDPADGEISYTRDGSFTLAQFTVPPAEDAPLNEDGSTPEPTIEWRLSDGDGRCVLDTNGNFIRITDPNAEVHLGVFDFALHDGFLHADSGRFLPVEKNGQLYWGTGTVKRKVLEMSNTDLALELTKVVESQRAYSYALKMVQTSDEIETTINGLRG